MQKYTAKELSEILNISVPATWKKVNKLLEEEKGNKINRISMQNEMVNNRDIKVIYIEDSMLDEIINNTMVNKPNYENKPEVNRTNNQFNEQAINPSFDKEIYIKLIETQERLINYAEQVGQVKLLTDSENNYKNEYLRLVQENAVLTSKLNQFKNQVEQLQNENELNMKESNEKISLLEAENQQLKQKSFFGLKFGK